MNAWVEIKLLNSKQSLAIINFLLDIAKRPRPFKTDDMVEFNKEVLNFKTSPRILRDLRQQGLVKYEVIDTFRGIYQLQSNYSELLQSRGRIEQGGYWIDNRTPVFMSSKLSVNVDQLNLI